MYPAVEVASAMFTAASVDPGLNNDNASPPPWEVAPCAKYHCGAVDDAHGVMLHPSGLETTSEAVTPPPSKTTEAPVAPAWAS